MKYLSIPAAMEASEIEFKQAKYVTVNRIQLKPHKAEMLIFLKYYLRAVDYVSLDDIIVPSDWHSSNSGSVVAPEFEIVINSEEIEHEELDESECESAESEESDSN